MPPTALQPFEILVRAPNWLGDACMALPAVRAIKRGRPDARVTVLTTAKLAGLWRAVPEVDAVIEKSDHDGVLAVQRAIRATGVTYDVAVLMVDSPRSAFEVQRCGIRRVVGCHGQWRKWLLDQIVPAPRPGPIQHHRNSFLRIAAHCGAHIEAAEEPVAWRRPDAAPSPGGVAALALCPGAEYGPAKRWPLDRFAKAALAVADETPVEWTLVGSPSETALGAELAAMMNGRCRNRVGETSLTELMDVLAGSKLLLTNDTGTMHLAAALGTPVIAIFGSTEPAWTGPVGPGHAVIRRHVDCSPCFLQVCPRKSEPYRCFDAVTPEAVAEAVLAKLRGR
jgi:ADP-heptose:LPS heptosyltransferase